MSARRGGRRGGRRTREQRYQRKSVNVTDPIADMLTRIRNAVMAGHETVTIPGSNVRREIARVLAEEGYIESWEWLNTGSQGAVRITLKYGPEKERVISHIQRVSRPGLRVYAKAEEIPDVLGGLGICILSTSHGIMTGRHAREQGVGGEVLCEVW